MDRCSGLRVTCSGIGGKDHMLSINRGIRLDSVENAEAGEKVDGSDGQRILRLRVSRRKESGDVAQLVRALPDD
jgi:hypothetical protein